MRLLISLILLFFLANCSKPKTVLICGDHVCVNKAEAEQFFEENLTIEVKVINKKKNKKIDLVELNLSEKGSNRKISLSSKKTTNEKLKTLSNKEVKEIKKIIKKKSKDKKMAKKTINKKVQSKKIDNEITKSENNKITLKNVNKNRNDVTDVCTIIEKCSIDEISKYLLQQGKKKGFPDITIRQ